MSNLSSSRPAAPSRGRRLLRRYPALAPVPEDERPAVVRAAIRHPAVLILVLGIGLLLLPLYFDWVFRLLRVEQEANLMLWIAEVGGAVLVPCIVAVPVLSRFVIPVFIRREMKKRGYGGKE